MRVYLALYVECVRRAYLCGIDTWSGRSYEYRRDWVRDRVKAMSQVFAVDVLAFSVMSNHFHLVLRNDVNREKGWSDEDVVRRWLAVYPKRHMQPDGTYVYESRPEDVVCVLEEEGRVDMYGLCGFESGAGKNTEVFNCEKRG